MKKRFMSLLLIGFIAAAYFPHNTQIMSYGNEITTADENIKEVKADDEIHGFKVIKVNYDENTQCKNISLKHIKTGAKMLIIKNDDLNRGFSIDFNTPSENDKGINHILEHSLLGGSEKYPINNMIFNVMNSTYTSFINAFTYQNMTAFPVSSQSEKQLMKLTDVYLDAVYNPLIIKDKRIFDREAWRYEMNDINSPIIINGIVYNEMKGSNSNIDIAAICNAKKSVFRDTNQKYNSGGDPESILNLSYEEFLNTYRKNYLPSNSFMVLYGDVDYESFLKMINDNYLSSRDNSSVDIERTESKKFEALPVESFDFPAAADYNCNNKSVIDLVFALPDMKTLNVEDLAGIILATSILNLNSSDLNIELQNSNIAENYKCSIDLDTYQPTIHFIAKNADENRKKDFYEIIIKELKKISDKGFNKESVKSIMAGTKFSDAFAHEVPAYSKMLTACSMDNLLGDGTIDLNSYIKTIEKRIGHKYLEHIILKYILNNNCAALTATVPKAGFLEEKSTTLKNKLQEKKDNMSSEEKSKLVEDTKNFKSWIETQPDKEVLNSLKAISSKDLPVEVKDYNVLENAVDGVKVYIADVHIKDAGCIGLIFDESHLSKEELLYLQFYAGLLNSVIPSNNYSEKSLSNELLCKCRGIGYKVTSFNAEKSENSAYPVFRLDYQILKDDINDMLDLNAEILLNSKINDISSYITRTISSEKSSKFQYITQSTENLLIRSSAHDNLKYRYINYLNGIDYYNFILSLEKDFNENPDHVYEKLNTVKNKAFNRNNLTVLFAGDKASQYEFKNNLENLTSKLRSSSYEKAVYDLPMPSKREAITTNTEVAHVAIAADLEKSSVDYNGKLNVIAKILNDKVLIPELRLKGGSYSMNAMAGHDEFRVYTYRDNNFENTLKIANSSGRFIKNINSKMDDNDLESYIISSFASENLPTGEISGAYYRLLNEVQGYTAEDEKQILDEIKNTTKTSLDDAEIILDKLKDSESYVVLTSREMAEAHKDLFDNIISIT